MILRPAEHRPHRDLLPAPKAAGTADLTPAAGPAVRLPTAGR